MPSPQSSTFPPTYFHGLVNNYTAADEDEEEPGFSEIQTVALACFLTLLPLMFGLVSYFGFRLVCKGARKSRRSPYRRPYALYCWGRFKRTVEPSDLAKSLDREASQRNRSSHALLNEQMKGSESQFSVVREDAEDVDKGNSNAYTSASSNQTSKATANGSIITMTMKNNHLIVETEVTQSDVKEGSDTLVVEVDAPDAIVHQESPDSPLTGGANTGISTSDLSSSSDSLTGHYRTYNYGTQQEFCSMDSDPTQQLICHVVAEPNSGPQPELVLELAPKLEGETNPGFVPTPVEPPTVTS